MKEIYLVLSFFLVNGFLSPSFGQFSYFFMLNVAHITKFQFAMFGVISRACHILGTIFYKNYFKNTETRTIICYSTAISVVSSFIHLAFAMRWNIRLGISDIIFVIFTDVVFGCMSLALCVLPSLALFAKITPVGVEGTIFAFLTGIWNFSDGVISPMMGAFVNKQVGHVTANDLSNYHKLMTVSFVSSFLGFFILPLIPLHNDIELYKKERAIHAQEEEDASTDHRESRPLLGNEPESEPFIMEETRDSPSAASNGTTPVKKNDRHTSSRAESTESASR